MRSRLCSGYGSKMADPEAAPSQAGGPTTKRLDFKHQTLDDAYAAPANLLEIELSAPETHGIGRGRYTDYVIRMKVRLAFIMLGWVR